MGYIDRTKNVFKVIPKSRDRPPTDLGPGSNQQLHIIYNYAKSALLAPIINKIANDVSLVNFKHTKKEDNALKEVDDGLNSIFTLEANIDQSSITFMRFLVENMFDEGIIACVPTMTSSSLDGAFDVYTMRVARILNFYPKHIRVEVFNDETGYQEEMYIEKSKCPIIENPFYSTINDENSTMKRLLRKFALIDSSDEELASNAWNIILQMPYEIRTDAQKAKAEDRIKRIEEQLNKKYNKHGVAYIDATEKLTPLGNAGSNNNLLNEITKLKDDFYNELGMTKGIFDGSATEDEKKNYRDSVVYLICKVIAQEFNRKMFTPTARTQGHAITYGEEIFKLGTLDQMSNAIDILKRNGVISTNEARKLLGFDPSTDPSADALFNPNITSGEEAIAPGEENQNGKGMHSDEEMVKVFEDMENNIQKLNDEQVGLVIEELHNILGEFDDSLIEDKFNELTDDQAIQLSEFIANLINEKTPTDQGTEQTEI